ncbi:MAG: hypothetical protein EBV03_10915 [Proteobacteria bacterium]|nr:hypothetical protein [Pseudomonadota bacterium]
MSASFSQSMPAARPKIHRLPALPPRKPVRKIPKMISSSVPYLVLGALFTMLAMSSAPANKSKPEELEQIAGEAHLLPKISVNSQLDSEPVALMAKNQPPADLPTTLTDLQPAVQDKKDGNTIVLRDHSTSIVGQMARIPLENEHITEVKPLQDVDNVAGRELLSILNKY